MRPVIVILALGFFGWACTQAEVSTPTPVPGQPKRRELKLGTRERVLAWTSEEKRDGFANMDRVFTTRAITRDALQPKPAFALPVALRDLSQVKVDGKDGQYGIDEYRERQRVAGLLVIKDGQIVYEHYAFGHSPTTKWTSWSVAKSLVSLLVGAALRDGYIRSLDDLVSDYLPHLKGSAYASVSLKHLMQMASGVQWNERYDDPSSDVGKLGGLRRAGEPTLLRYLGAKPRVAEPGKQFNYNTAETHLVSSVVRAAVGNNLSDYLSRTIWSRFAMESDAYWVVDDDSGAENGGCCFSATLRDYGRLGLFALRKGQLPDGTWALPEGYMGEATRPSPAQPAYGYLWWLARDSYGARGIFGQQLQIYPADNLVIVSHAFADDTRAPFNDSAPLFDGIRNALATGK